MANVWTLLKQADTLLRDAEKALLEVHADPTVVRDEEEHETVSRALDSINDALGNVNDLM